MVVTSLPAEVFPIFHNRLVVIDQRQKKQTYKASLSPMSSVGFGQWILILNSDFIIHWWVLKDLLLEGFIAVCSQIPTGRKTSTHSLGG